MTKEADNQPLPPHPSEEWKAAPEWVRERAETLHRLCQEIARRNAAGESIHKVADAISARWDAKPFKSDPRKSWRLSKSRLVNLFFEWKKVPSPETLLLRYQVAGSSRTVTDEDAAEFAEFATRHESLEAAHVAWDNEGRTKFSHSSLRRALNRRLRNILKQTHSLNLALRHARAALRKELSK